MLKCVGTICAALVVAAAAFSTSVEARSGGTLSLPGGVRAGGFGGSGGVWAELILAAHVLALATLAVPVWAAPIWAVRA